MGKTLTVRIIGNDWERGIRMREHLTINNLKTILTREMKTEKENIKLILEGKELQGHQRLSDLGLEDGTNIGIELTSHYKKVGKQEGNYPIVQDSLWVLE